jgi:hypothetical protein
MALQSPFRKCQNLAACARSAKNAANARLTVLLRDGATGHSCEVLRTFENQKRTFPTFNGTLPMTALN